MLKFGNIDHQTIKSWNLFRFKFAIVSTDERPLIEFIFNSDFGLRIINNTKNDGKKRDFYLDIDLDFYKITKQLFLVFHEAKVYISVNGLSFSDIIFIDDLNDPFSGVSSYKIKID